MNRLLDSAAVATAIEGAADPVRARACLERIVGSRDGLAAELGEGGRLLDAVVAISCASDSLTAAMASDEHALDHLRAGLETEVGARQMQLELAATLDGAADPAAMLRAWKRREVIRVAARDLLGLADLSTVGRELAAVAQSCLRAALEVVAPAVPVAIIGMGKLGARELNYASDVDVLFVHEHDTEEALRAARDLLKLMTAHTSDGIVFRTDADLRPEGRNGPLSRTLDSYEAYWDRWAASWEFQALLKAQPVAGDTELGASFVARAESRVWPDVMDRERIRDIRLGKNRAEKLLASEGLAEREVKRGRGGIRDVEFAVQLLQLVHGRHDHSVRTPATLDALAALSAAGYIATADAARLGTAYEWLRTVEHRLQLWQEKQTHTLPAGEQDLDRLAKVTGFRATPEQSAVEQFTRRHRGEQAAVRSLHEKIFFAPVLDTLAGTGALPLSAAAERLEAFGFNDVDQTREAMAELTKGLSRRSRIMADLFPAMLEWLAEGADPDLGLLQMRRLAEGYTRSLSLVQLFRETPHAAERLCRVLASSRVLGMALHHQPEAVADFADDNRLDYEPTREELVDEALGTLDWRFDDEGRWVGLRRFKRRQLLRVATRDLLGRADVDAIGRELTNLAEAALEAALDSLEPEVPVAVIGMGRLGGGELSYASDIDVMFVHEGEGAAAFDAAERTATRLMRAVGSTAADGRTWHIDADLRPEGRGGVLTRSLDGYREYYARWAQTWEFQSLLRARPVAGDPELGRRFCEMIEPHVYRDPLPAESSREVRRMKARIEKERIPHGEDPRYHLKLGPGSLSDVEFTVQLLQLENAGTDPAIRTPSTKAALEVLDERRYLDGTDAEIFSNAYDLCERVRNYRYLLTGTPSDWLPVDEDEATKVARMLGYTQSPASRLRDDYRRVTRRARSAMERIFYNHG